MISAHIADARSTFSGDADPQPWLVTIGRSNFRKSSAAIEQLVLALQGQGLQVFSFESQRTQVARAMDMWWQGLGAGRVAGWCAAHGRVGDGLRKGLKAWRLATAGQWKTLLYLLKTSPNEQAADELRAVLQQWQQTFGPRRVYLLGHSAGALVATLVHDAPNVVGLVGFGYPFKHPDRGEEPIRTRHLGQVSKPFLLIQGEADSYGTPAQALGYGLSASTRVVSVAATHDYHLSPEQQAQCLAWLQAFMHSSGSDPE